MDYCICDRDTYREAQKEYYSNIEDDYEYKREVLCKFINSHEDDEDDEK